MSWGNWEQVLTGVVGVRGALSGVSGCIPAAPGMDAPSVASGFLGRYGLLALSIGQVSWGRSWLSYLGIQEWTDQGQVASWPLQDTSKSQLCTDISETAHMPKFQLLHYCPHSAFYLRHLGLINLWNKGMVVHHKTADAGEPSSQKRNFFWGTLTIKSICFVSKLRASDWILSVQP